MRCAGRERSAELICASPSPHCCGASPPGGILTVADDLLKNDGQKFLEMMEQLADKRIQREREAVDLADDEDDEGSEEDYDDEE